jgi:hypothetical protein
MATSGFARDAAYFDLLAARSTNPFLRHDLHQVAEHCRSLAEKGPSQDLSDPEHWKLRAQECRALAERFHSGVCREQLHRLAATYDALSGYARKQCRTRG